MMATALEKRSAWRRSAAMLVAAMALPALAAAGPITAGDPVLQKCDNAIASALVACVGSYSNKVRKAYEQGQATHFDLDDPIVGAIEQGKVLAKVSGKCSGAGTLQALGFGPQMGVSNVAERIWRACFDSVGSLVARSFGGPHGVVFAGASSDDKLCLDGVYKEGAKLIKKALAAQSACVRKAHKGGTCDTTKLANKLQKDRAKLIAKVPASCVTAVPVNLVGTGEVDIADRALEQSRCLTAAAHPDSEPLSLDCGPRAAVAVPPRGQWVQVTLDSDVWGTKCGDGSPYTFWLRLAPNGAAPEKAVINLQGGGVCVFDSDCLDVQSSSPGLFRADDDWLPSGPSGGVHSTNPVNNPFADWTMMALPYCTQDVFMGGGVTNVFPGVTVRRYGALNLRAALRYLRDVLWAELDATTAAGFRPDVLRVLFGGESAGGFGVSYNYHYVLDDLRWVHTTAMPDSALGLDNGTTSSVRTLGAIVVGPAYAGGWETRPFQPPYCLSSDCAVVPEGQAAASLRLGVFSDQVILNLSNQVDEVQRDTTMFSDMPAWTNATRVAYCANKGKPGLFHFLPAEGTSIHTMLTNQTQFDYLTAEGTTLRQFLTDAVASPGAVTDRVDEGDLVALLGVSPFGCSLDD